MKLLCKAILFDLDGVLINSFAVIERHWRKWAGRHQIPFERVNAVLHGRTSAEIIRLVAPHLDPEEEGRLRESEEGMDTDGLQVFEAAPRLLHSLPPDSWAVVTSGNLQTATTRLRYGGLPVPTVLVTAGDVKRSKPAPDGYLLAAQRLGIPPGQCIVIEDAPAGIEAACAAGMRAIAVATTHPPEALEKATFIVRELADLTIKMDENHLWITPNIAGLLEPENYCPD